MAKIKVRTGRRSPMVMQKAEKERELRARLKWLLDFLNKDIDSISRIECLKLVLDVATFIYGPFYEMFPEINLKPETDLTKEKKFLNICQEHLRFLLRGILTGLKQIGTKPTLGIPANFDLYVVYYGVFISKRNDRVFKTPVFRGRYLLDIPENLWDGRIVEGVFVDEQSGLLYRGLLTDALIEILSRFPLSRIRTCQKPDCRNYFYQKTTKSKGDFCSRKCQNWANTNRWRKANPDKYNAYHRNRRAKAKADWVEVKCRSCRYQESRGLLGEYLMNYSGSEDCPQCEKAKLLHIVTRWDKSERSWIPEEYTFIEWKNYLRGIKKGEG